MVNTIQAIIFTHCNNLKYDDDDRIDEQGLIDQYTQSFRNYLECNTDKDLIRDVFAYIDQGIRELIPRVGRAPEFTLEPHVLRKEHELKDILQIAEREARHTTGMNRDRLPQFHFVGLEELVDLVHSLWTVDSTLMQSLCGRTGRFTYDSPKFVEAVIRLARGDIPHLAQDPVIRIDDDAEVNAKSISILLEEFKKVTNKSPFYFFSGKYGRLDGNYDPINDYAVRTHWFFPEGTKASDARFGTEPHFTDCIDVAETFLSDLTVLGARQPISKGHRYSQKLQQFVSEGRLPTKPRLYPQVISGAGLIMSRRSVALLPPFMNFSNLITWVDDHLKRELHEKLGDIGVADVQCIANAKFEQNRHDPCLTKKEIDDADNGIYFNRLLDGCVLSTIITDDTVDSGTLTYSDIIRDIVTYRMQESKFSDTMRTELIKKIKHVGTERYDLVLQCWKSEEFKSFASYRWADKELSQYRNSIQTKPIPELVNTVVADAMDYIGLLFNWHKFTRAVERSKFIGNAWLYF